MQNLKKYKLIYLQDRITDVGGEKNSWLPRGGGRINWKIGINIYTLLYIKLITEENLLKNMGNSTQYSPMTYMEK